ncbi:MAG: hypothetical protein WDN76_04660 [Alphaproteobacteria bacterium]
MGISVVPIYGVHFDVYAKLFSEDALPKKCAIVTDGDLKPSDAHDDAEAEDDFPPPADLQELENDYVKVFACKTTFERALLFEGTLEMFARAADDVDAPVIAKKLRDALERIEADELDETEKNQLLNPLRDSVLNTAKRFGKARFAQVVARHVNQAQVIPKYLGDAVEWLKAQ